MRQIVLSQLTGVNMIPEGTVGVQIHGARPGNPLDVRLGPGYRF